MKDTTVINNKHILLADDEQNTCIGLSFILETAGHRVTSVLDGQQALDFLFQCRESGETIDLLITDIQMPKLNGLELIEKLNEINVYIPSIVITGYGDKETLMRLLRSGCMDYIDKPFTPSQFLSHVNEVLLREDERRLKVESMKNRLRQEIDVYKHQYEIMRKQLTDGVDYYNQITRIQTKPARYGFVCRNLPLESVGGDFYDLHEDQNGMTLVAADVAGHEIGAAFQSVLIKAVFMEKDWSQLGGAAFCSTLNTRLNHSIQNDRFVSLCWIYIKEKNLRASVILCGHPQPLLLRGNSIRPIGNAGMVLGIMPDTDLKETAVDLEPGDRILCYTDGVINTVSKDPDTEKPFKLQEAGLIEIIRKHQNQKLQELTASVWADVLLFCGQKPNDDMLLIGIEIP